MSKTVVLARYVPTVAILCLMVSGFAVPQEKALAARILGSSSQGGYLVKFDDPATVRENDVLSVVRDGRRLGEAVVGPMNADGSVIVMTRFTAQVWSTDRLFLVARASAGSSSTSIVNTDMVLQTASSTSYEVGSSTSDATIKPLVTRTLARGMCAFELGITKSGARYVIVSLREGGSSSYVICNRTSGTQLVELLRLAEGRLGSGLTHGTKKIGEVRDLVGGVMMVWVTKDGRNVGLTVRKDDGNVVACLLRLDHSRQLRQDIESAMSLF